MRRAMRSVVALLLMGGVACVSDDTGNLAAASISSGPPAATASSPSPALAIPKYTKGCPKTKAVDLTGDDPFKLVIHNFRFTPNCFIVRASASLAIENMDDVGHTFKIDGTLVNAPLVPHQTYTHGPSTGFLEPGVAYPFHCSIHPQITGTMIVV